MNALSEAVGAMQDGSQSKRGGVQDGVANAWADVKGAGSAVFDRSDNDLED
jgi:hypothetical protein